VFVPCNDLSTLLFFATRAVEAEVVVLELDLLAVDDPGLVAVAVARPHNELGTVIYPALDVNDEFGKT